MKPAPNRGAHVTRVRHRCCEPHGTTCLFPFRPVSSPPYNASSVTVRHRRLLGGTRPPDARWGLTIKENTMLRGFMLGAATALALAAATPAHAVVELQWWHAMTGGNNDVIVKLTNDFNASQNEYKVVPSYKGSYP